MECCRFLQYDPEWMTSEDADKAAWEYTKNPLFKTLKSQGWHIEARPYSPPKLPRPRGGQADEVTDTPGSWALFLVKGK